MQLTVDTEAPIDIEFKMSTIKEVTLKEKNINVLDTFCDNVTNSDDIVKNVTSKLANKNHEVQNDQLDCKIEQDTASTTTTESEGENNTSKESSVDDCESKSLSPTSNTNEINKTEDIVNKDITINQHHELEPQNKLNNYDSEKKENVDKTETNDILDSDIIKQKSNSITSENKMKDHSSDDDVNTKDNKKIIVNDIEKNVLKQTNDDTKNLDIESSDSHSVIDEVFNETDEKKEQPIEEGSQSQYESTVQPISSKINNNKKESEKTEHEIDLTFENTPKDGMSINEKKITKEGVANAEPDIKNSTIEILEEEKTNGINKPSEEISNKIDEDKTKSSLISKLSNILDILSDDEEERHEDAPNVENTNIDKQCISLVDDDDVMLIDEDTSVKEDTNSISIHADKIVPETCDESTTPNQRKKDQDEVKALDAKHEAEPEEVVNTLENNELGSKTSDIKESMTPEPLLPLNFLNTCKKNLADMTREDLEDFCSLKIVESVMDRSNLGDLKSQLKTMTLTIEEFKKKTTLLAKQNRDLQVVLKSIQEEQKKVSVTPIIPLKITRSVGMQVLMTDKPNAKRKNAQILNSSVVPNQPLPIDKSNRNTGVQKAQKTKNQPIPVPRLVPAANTGNKASTTTASNTTDPGKSVQTTPVNGVRNSPPTQKPEKRSRLQSVTVDLTDDEPPMKVTAKSSPAPAVRLVPAQNLLPPQRPQFAPTMSSPRKVYIPISGPQSQNVRPGQTVVLKQVPPNPGPRPRMPANNNVNKMQSNTIRMNRALPTSRHPAPLPDAVKQYQPTSWKALPPAPDLKLSKVENGIVISWKIDGYQEDSYEEIISYQLFAYQETNSPPSTALWKKIGDVKALPLPMACTLTQFLAGYKYYFAVRAVDVKSRFGPFSLPASILLLNKM